MAMINITSNFFICALAITSFRSYLASRFDRVLKSLTLERSKGGKVQVLGTVDLEGRSRSLTAKCGKVQVLGTVDLEGRSRSLTAKGGKY